MTRRLDSWYSKFTLAAAGCVGFAMLLGAPQVRADHCQKRVNKADHRLHEAIEDHGYNSEQAEDARDQLRDARESCWSEEHRWWDSDDNSWHNDRDWDDNDHRNYDRRDRDHRDRDHHDDDDSR